MFWLFIKRGGGIAIFLAVFSAVALFAGVAQSGFADRFAEAEVVQAQVVKLKKSARYQSGSTSTTYYVTVSMPGARHRGTVSGRFFATLQEGQQIPVRVLKETPRRYEIEPGHMESSSLWALAMGALLAVSSLGLSVMAWRTARRELSSTP